MDSRKERKRQIYAYESHAACTFNQEYNHAAFQISFMLTSYAIPLAIICLLYFGMLFRLWKSVSAAGSSGRSLRGKKRVTRMVVVVVGVFAVCWLPIQVVLLLKSLKLYEITDLSVAIQITAHVLGYMNSCVNPLIYSVLSENFRKAFRKVIQCRRHAPSPHNTKPRPSTTHHAPEELLPLRRPSSQAGHGGGAENSALLLQDTHVVAFSSNNGTPHATMVTSKVGNDHHIL
ncbi:Allatostatin-A receptor [Folsomia candida]|uniref:Allatostatin-A receptor n=1 Tax=Folsomia candida TaxID=158441 RepID=A0A226EFH9_FOLCA|nr:Allatostatin-A receptor [Folsomia candida]